MLTPEQADLARYLLIAFGVPLLLLGAAWVWMDWRIRQESARLVTQLLDAHARRIAALREEPPA